MSWNIAIWGSSTECNLRHYRPGCSGNCSIITTPWCFNNFIMCMNLVCFMLRAAYIKTAMCWKYYEVNCSIKELHWENSINGKKVTTFVNIIQQPQSNIGGIKKTLLMYIFRQTFDKQKRSIFASVPIRNMEMSM